MLRQFMLTGGKNSKRGLFHFPTAGYLTAVYDTPRSRAHTTNQRLQVDRRGNAFCQLGECDAIQFEMRRGPLQLVLITK